jgi:hypothetical protein
MYLNPSSEVGQRSHQVHMEVGKMAVRDWNQMDNGSRLTGHLPSLTLFAASTPSGHICSISLPDGAMGRIDTHRIDALDTLQSKSTSPIPLLQCSSDPYLWLTDPDLAPDSALFVSDLQNGRAARCLSSVVYYSATNTSKGEGKLMPLYHVSEVSNS